MRIKCEQCDGKGLSRERASLSCWDCCGRGDIPEYARDVRSGDIGFGVGLSINYDRAYKKRLSFQLSGTMDSPVIAIAPPNEPLPPYHLMHEATKLLLSEWQAGSGEPLGLKRTREILYDVDFPF